MKSFVRLALLATASSLAGPASAVETIVFVRHGEKPAEGLGQLNCKGLNRALALPSVIKRLATAGGKADGKPDAIFAPDPSDQKEDKGQDYDYVRPLATIEPSAIVLGMPVNTQIGFDDVKGLTTALQAPAYRDGTVVVAWEHKIIIKVERRLLDEHGGEAVDVPKWRADDFDRVDTVTIDWSAPESKATFSQTKEGLDNQPEACPG
jgi:hypothetical protein